MITFLTEYLFFFRCKSVNDLNDCQGEILPIHEHLFSQVFQVFGPIKTKFQEHIQPYFFKLLYILFDTNALSGAFVRTGIS